MLHPFFIEQIQQFLTRNADNMIAYHSFYQMKRVLMQSCENLPSSSQLPPPIALRSFRMRRDMTSSGTSWPWSIQDFISSPSSETNRRGKQTNHTWDREKGRMFVLENVQFSLHASIFNPYFIKPTRIPHQHLAACAWQRSLITCIYTRKPVSCFSYSNTSSVSIIINSVCSYSVTHRC